MATLLLALPAFPLDAGGPPCSSSFHRILTRSASLLTTFPVKRWWGRQPLGRIVISNPTATVANVNLAVGWGVGNGQLSMLCL